MTRKKFSSKEGICIGLADGKIVVESKSINKVMNTLIEDYSDKEITISSIPKGNKIFVL